MKIVYKLSIDNEQSIDFQSMSLKQVRKKNIL